MVVNCVVQGCKNRGGQFDDNGVKIGWHRFPHRDQLLLSQWIEALDRPGWKPSDSSHVCSAHFLPSDYVFCPGAKAKRLKPLTVPTVFEFCHGRVLGVTRAALRHAKHELLLRAASQNSMPEPPPPSPSPPLPTHPAPTSDNGLTIDDYLIPEVQYSNPDSTDTLTIEEQPSATPDSLPGMQRTYSRKPAGVTLHIREAPTATALPRAKPLPPPTAPRRVYFQRPKAPRPYTQPLTIHRKVAIEHDHQYSQDNFLSTSNRSDVYVTKLEETVRKLTADVAQLKKDNVLLKQAAHRRARLVAKLNRRIAELAQTINQQQQATGAENLSRLMQMLLDNGQRNAARVAQGRQYSREMRQFCRTVHHFSPPAYRFLKEQLYLPDPRSLRKWASEGSSAAAATSEDAGTDRPPVTVAPTTTTISSAITTTTTTTATTTITTASTNKDFGGGFAEIDFSHLEDGPDEVPSANNTDFVDMDDGGGGGEGLADAVVDGCTVMDTMNLDHADPGRLESVAVPATGSVLDFSHLDDDELEEGGASTVLPLPDFCRIAL